MSRCVLCCRCVRPARPPGSCPPSQAPLAPLSQGVMRKPAPSSSATVSGAQRGRGSEALGSPLQVRVRL